MENKYKTYKLYKPLGKTCFIKTIKHLRLLIFIICILFIGNHALFGQEQGDLIIRNYSAIEYKASMSNWALAQDSQGIMYFGNELGLLQFDGTNWDLIPLPKDLIIRSIDINNKGVIYIGSYGELGYMHIDSIGKMTYKSLIGKLNIEDIKLQHVWFTHCINEDVWFITYNTLFRLRNGEFKTWKSANRFSNLIKYKDRIFIAVRDEGIKEITEDSLILVPGSDFFKDKPFWNTIPIEDHKILIPTYNSGLYTFDFNKVFSGEDDKLIEKFPTKIDSLFLKHRAYNSIKLKNGNIAIGLISGGVVILNKKGGVIRHLNKKNGLQNNFATDLFEDTENNLWITTSEGISKTNINSPITFWGKRYEIDGYFNDIKRFNNEIYTARYDGIFKLSNNKVKKISNIDTPVFSLLNFKNPENKLQNKLLAGTNYNGLIEINNDKIIELLPDINTIFYIYQSTANPSIVYIGRVDGLSVAQFKNNKWELLGEVKDVNHRIRDIFEDSNGYLWLSNRENEVIRITPSKNILEPKKIDIYSTGQSANYIVRINSINKQLIFGDNKGVLHYSASKDKLISDSSFIKSFENTPVSVLNIFNYGDENILISAYRDNNFGIAVRKKDGTYKWFETAFKALPEIQVSSSYFESDSTLWIAGSEGLFRFKGDFNKQEQEFQAIIKQVLLNNDSIIYYGNKSLGSNNANEINGRNVEFEYKHNSFIFKYTATSFYDESRTKYQTYLEGYDSDWSNWSVKTEKEYTNLNEGDYTMHVRAKNIFETISSEATYSITVLPPWHRSVYAYIIYIIGLVLFIWLIVFLNAKRLKAINTVLEETVKERTVDLHEVNTQLEEKQTDLEQKQEEILSQRDAIERQNKELEKLSIIASETDNAITIMDPQGNFEWFNDAYVRLYDYSLEEFIKAKGKNIIKASDNKDIKKIIDLCITNKTSVNYESEIVARSGKTVWTQVTITPILDEDNNILKLISIESDIQKLKEYEKDILHKNEELETQRDAIEKQNKELESQRNSIERQNHELEKHRNHLDQLVKERTEELEKAMKKAEESDRLKSAFLANMSHEIRTPMNAIVGFSDLLIDPDIDPDDKVDLSFRISQNCDSLLRLIDDIIDLAKIESEQLVIEKSEFKLKDVLSELYTLYNQIMSTINKKHIKLKINPKCAKSELTIFTDRIRLKQILINLLDNALKFTEKGGIEYGFTVEKSYFKFYVKDSGIGITEDESKEIFTRFRKVESYQKTLYRGAGLGLSISKNIVELLEGKIWVKSSLNDGSTFYFTIPNQGGVL